ncbi:GNAT family N-acetyltransferase [Rhodoligotrophos defluvii]|uniref:GNAT family N-acetyltransferase n=1 Tax=Rhodoligotrophos defluvii TaxID=2561934 RepID=UPI0010C9F222|nr:GNAT family N-acyltransferase [Rhodoligotrophos defluvii]
MTANLLSSLPVRPAGLHGPGPTPAGMVLGRKGDLEVRLCRDGAELSAAQALRYCVFYEERGAHASPEVVAAQRDSDPFDDVCDHLLVIAPASGSSDPARLVGEGEVVGTYRLLRQEIAETTLGFYTQDEFDIAPLVASKPDLRFLELGRSCVLKPYRTRPVVELLWQGIWNYVRLHRLDVMLGCASLEGTDLDALRQPLKFLQQHFRPPAEWHVRAHPERAVFVDDRPDEPVDGTMDERMAMRALPPLIKGYLRLGAYIGEGAFVDHQFNTVDVLIILPVSAINSRYFSHFGAPGEVPATT